MSILIQCIYSSVASDTFNEDDLLHYWPRRARRIQKRGVTGMLAYINGNFLQVIEGDDVVIDGLFNTIKRDPRHKRVLLLARTPITTRYFAIGAWDSKHYCRQMSAHWSVKTTSSIRDHAFPRWTPGIVKTILSSFRQTQAGLA